jgi:uncharacterized protein (TIGR00369 family)
VSDDLHHRALERMYLGAPINAYFQPRIAVGDGVAEIALEARPDLHHAAHAVHGSVYFKLLDDSAFFAAQSLVTESFVVTTSFHLDLLRPVVGGTLTARGRVVHRSTRILMADSELVDGEGRVLARGGGLFLPSRVALGPGIGYGMKLAD